MPFAPVVIVGGGPVGMMLAMNLAALDVPSLVVNIEPGSRWHPKGSTQNARTMEHYRRLGIARGLRTLGLPPDHPTDVAYFTTLDGWELARLAMPSEAAKMRQVAAAGPTDQVPEPLLRCNQMYAEAYLFRHVQTQRGIGLRYGWRCEGFRDRGDGIEVEIEEVGSGRRETWSCAYIVGCDGGQSVIRRQLGIAYVGERPREQTYGSGPTVSTHLRAPALYRGLVRGLCWQYWVVNPTVRSNLVTLDGAGEFLFNTRLRNAADTPDRATIARQFQASVGAEIEVEFLAHWPWTAGQALVAERFGAGRVLLAGDAVHLFTPTGGFGMNTGIDDAANLGWKLAAVVQGWGGPSLLASYEIERRPIAQRNTAAAKQFSRNVGDVPMAAEMVAESPEGAAARAKAGAFLATFGEEFGSLGVQLGARYDGSPIIVSDGTAPPPDDPTHYHPSACPGGRAPHLFLADRSSLFDHFGRGFTLLRLNPDAETRPLEDAARARGIPLAIFAVDRREGRELYEGNLALIRPDQHVAWRGNRLPPDCDALLARATGW